LSVWIEGLKAPAAFGIPAAFLKWNCNFSTETKESHMQFTWEEVPTTGKVLHTSKVYRSMVPGGWLVFVQNGVASGLSFYPDPEHTWEAKAD
jgi:hypothetical protein